ncbi:MAG: type II secretion system protein GspG [Candidatus Sumerlaeia bacterium]|nr:type II secretion system protein GspG [Candidatus Sumerlaeia bacterium]
MATTAARPLARFWYILAAVLVLLFIGGLFVVIALWRTPGKSVLSNWSRARADMQALAVALESFYLDHNAYPSPEPHPVLRPDQFADGLAALPAGLTTPVAYVTARPTDPFQGRAMPYIYHASGRGWLLVSPGPDGRFGILPARDFDSSEPQPSPRLIGLTYDPTNGLISSGDIWRVGP